MPQTWQEWAGAVLGNEKLEFILTAITTISFPSPTQGMVGRRKMGWVPAGCGFIHGIGGHRYWHQLPFECGIWGVPGRGTMLCSQLQATQIVLFIWVQLAWEEIHKARCGRDCSGGHDCGLALGGQWVMENGRRDLHYMWLVEDVPSCSGFAETTNIWWWGKGKFRKNNSLVMQLEGMGEGKV